MIDSINSDILNDLDGTFCKYDEKSNIIFGWAALNEWIFKGEWMPYIDEAGDHFTANAIRKMSERFAKGDGYLFDMHEKKIGKVVYNMPLVGDIPESMGMKLTKKGWSVGAEPLDDKIFDLVKQGMRKAFSVAGRPLKAEYVEVTI